MPDPKVLAEKSGVTRHPFAPDWPLQTLSTITFAAHEGGTTITVQWSPFAATAAERKAFDAGHGSMQQGWTGTMGQLDAYLAKAAKGRTR
jgi:uncharacterized protein YndB with AHSA1/START domain